MFQFSSQEPPSGGGGQDRKALGVLLLFLLAFCGVLGWGWMSQTPSFEEMYGGTARGGDFFAAMRSVGGWSWWTPNYLFGHSYALFSMSLLPLALLHGILWVVSPWVSMVEAPKLLGLIVIFFAGLSMYSLSRRLIGSAWAGVWTAVLYVTCAQFVLRLAHLEHQSTAACMVFSPLILLGMLRCEAGGGWRSAVLMGLSVSAMAMCYLKILLLFLPAGAVFLLWRLASCDAASRRHLLRGCFRGALMTIPLAIFPMIPLLRESRFLALFDLEPFAGWQQNYSFFSAITWVDWGNLLTQGTAIPALSPAKHASVEFYLGVVVLAGIFLPLWLGRSRNEWAALPAWWVLRLFAGLLLLATWLASGPRSILQSQFVYLSGAAGCPDFSIAIVWVMFVAMGGLIFLIAGKGVFRMVVAAIFAVVFFAVPGFRLLELVPFYGDIRAPSAIWPAFGSLSAILAAGSGWSLLAGLSVPRWQRLAALAFVAAFLTLDLIFLHTAFFRPGLPAKTFDDYAEAQRFLATAPLQGRVSAVSGRYFYLTTPRDSGRGLTSEALLRHLQLKAIRYMEAGSVISPVTMEAYYDLFGISYILVDRLDPDTPPAYQEHLKGLFPTVFENEGFTVLENDSSLYPAYAAKSVVSAEREIFRNPGSVLLLGHGGLIAVEDWTGKSVGKSSLTAEPDIPGRTALERESSLRKLSLREARTTDFHAFTVVGLDGADCPGLAVVTEAYHPDWKAEQNGHPLPVFRAVGGLISVPVESPGEVHFRFTPPWYYGVFMTLCLASWIVALGVFAVMRLPLPGSWKAAWYGRKDLPAPGKGRE